MRTDNQAPKDDGRGRSDRPGRGTMIYRALFGLCLVLLLIDVFYERHAKSGIEHTLGFYGIYSLACCVLLVLLARGIRKLVMRGEDYYDR